MKRRTFLQSLAAMAGMSAGCQLGYVAGKPVRYELFSTGDYSRYDLRFPFQQEHQVFTTDSRILIAEPKDIAAFENCKNLPPVSDLWWDEFDQSGWKPLPPQRLVKSPDERQCHVCYGTGRVGDDVHRCSTCDGNPRNWGPIDSMVFACPDCHFGWRGGRPCTLCPFSVDVDGDASFGFLPEGAESSEIIDGGRFDGGYMARLRTLPGDIEYRLMRDATIRGAWKYSQWDVLAFRWGNGGKGFLCGLELKE